MRMLLVLVWASTVLAAGPEFEVASVRPAGACGQGGSIAPGGTTFRASVPLLGLITFAYDVRPDQIEAAPAWASSACFEIVAKSGRPDPDPKRFLAEQREKVQNLLADRFHLRIRRESRERAVYALMVDKNEPKMRENKDLTSAPYPLIKTIAPGRFVAQIVSMPYLAQFLAGRVGRMVIDQTGLKSSYDFTLEWTPDAPPLAGTTTEATGPSLFTALREQLGLRLDSTRVPVDFLVIEQLDQPEPN